tara:strand:- start:1167 stop:1583 length:417 start_codon:yes stop_codon:yes gene_type:complete
MTSAYYKHQKGMSLLEIVVALAITSLILPIVINFFILFNRYTMVIQHQINIKTEEIFLDTIIRQDKNTADHIIMGIDNVSFYQDNNRIHYYIFSNKVVREVNGIKRYLTKNSVYYSFLKNRSDCFDLSSEKSNITLCF